MSDNNNIDPAIIKKTQETLGKFIKKPALTEKLLKKPPFRFLHDIINAVIKETGFLNGLYTKSELNSENIKDRDGKMEFLQKLIDVIKIVTNENITVRPSKIVSGHEPDKTNELLQLIGNGIEKKLDYSKAIETVLHGSGPKTTKTKTKETNSNDKRIVKTKSKESKLNENKKIKNEKLPEKSKTETKEKQSKIKEKEKVKKTTSNTKTGDKPSKNVKEAKIEPKLARKSEKIVPEVVKEPLKLHEKENEDSGKNENQILDNNNSLEPTLNGTKETEDLEKIDPLPTDLEKPEEELLPEAPIVDTGTEVNIETTETPSNSELIQIVDQEAEVRKKRSASQKARDERRKSIEEDSRSQSGTPIKQHSAKKTRSSEVVEKSKAEKIAKNEKKQKNDDPLQKRSANKNRSKRRESFGDLHNIVENEQNSKQQETNELKRESTFVRENSKIERPKTSLRPPSVRPASARPGAPRRRDKNVEIILQPNEQVKMAGINISVVDNFNTELEDDGENLVIIENSTTSSDINQKHDNENVDEISQQGHLVQQILETQKELTQTDGTGGVDVDNDIITLQKRKSSANQMNTLRDVIQVITRSIHPLGKLMDFLPEDIDSMQMELAMWRDSYAQAANELKKEKNLTESAIEPMKTQLTQINNNIKEHIEMIESSHSKILQNSEKIFKLLNE